MRRTDRTALVRELSESLDPSELEAVLQALDAYPAPEPAPAETAALVDRLRPLVTSPSRHRFRAGGLAGSPVNLLGGLLLGQVQLFHPAWWAVTALAAVLWPFAAEYAGVPAVLLAPPLAAAGVAYAFREAGSPAMEIELSCQVRPVHLMLARLLLVMTWVTCLGAVPVAMMPLAVAGGVRLGASMLSWSAGMLLFGGATLLLTLWAGPRGALGLGLVAWLTIALMRMIPNPRLPVWVLSDVRAAMLGAALCGLSLALAGRLFRLPGEEA